MTTAWSIPMTFFSATSASRRLPFRECYDARERESSCGCGLSEFVGIRAHPAKVCAPGVIDFAFPIRFNIRMKKLIPAILLAATPLLLQGALAQTRLTPKTAASHPDNCAPIGRTANGALVYSMKCDTIPAPPQTRIEETAPPPPAPPPQQETTRSGIFGWSYDRR